jgi:sugar lactone lactonase YvrE
MTAPARVGDFSLVWGESLRWDDRRDRLYFVDCGAQTLHWLEGAEPPLETMQLPSLPTGLALAKDGRLVAALDDGLHVVNPDQRTTELLSPYPEAMGGRANDADADLDGNLVTGTLNMGIGPGSYWWFSTSAGWRQLDDGVSNANGPVVLDIEGQTTLVVADTSASVIYAYPYDGVTGTVGERGVFFDTEPLGGMPDGACADDEGGVWTCVLGAGNIVRLATADAREGTVATGVELPSDVTFGGPALDAMFFVSIALDIGGVHVTSPHAGHLMRVDDTGFRGRPAPRIRL